MRSLLRPLTVAAVASALLFARSSRAQDNDLNAGGLAPPPPTSGPTAPQPQPPTQTEQELAKADKEDSGRGLEFLYFDVEGGGEYASLESLHVGNSGSIPSTSTTKTSDVGAMAGVGAGLRLVFLTIGPRFRVAHFSNWDLWSLNAELGIHIPLGSVEPYFTLGGGYAKVGNATQASFTSDNGVKITGYDVRGGFGIDYYVTNTFSVGVNGTAELLAMTRPGVNPTSLLTTDQQSYVNSGKNCASQPADKQQACAQAVAAQAQAQAYAADGSSLGIAGALSLVLGLHF
jgi:hypothetical protein